MDITMRIGKRQTPVDRTNRHLKEREAGTVTEPAQVPVVFAELQLTGAGASHGQQWHSSYGIPKAHGTVPTGGGEHVRGVVEGQPCHAHLMTLEDGDAFAGASVQDISTIVKTSGCQQSAIQTPGKRIAGAWEKRTSYDFLILQVQDLQTEVLLLEASQAPACGIKAGWATRWKTSKLLPRIEIVQ